MKIIRKSKYSMAFPVKDRFLLVNGLSGAVKLVSEKSAQKFFYDEVTPDVKPFLTHLSPGEEMENARSLCDFLMKAASTCADSQVAVTYDCNLRCPYCYEIWVKKPEIMRTVMDEYKVDKAFEALETLNKECREKKHLILTGGEPLMVKNKGVVDYLLKKGTDLGYTIRVFTNGVELDHFFSSLTSADIEYLQITVDGPPSLHNKRRIFKGGEGTFETITKNVDEARATGIRVVIRVNTDEEILSHIDELAAFFKTKGWVSDSGIHFSLAYTCDQHINPEKFDEQTRIYEAVMEVARRPETSFLGAYPYGKLLPLFARSPRFWPAFWNCNANCKSYALDPFGDVYACPSMLGWKEERIGVYVPELEFNENCEKWRRRTLFALEKCAECEIALVCGGGCGYAALLNNNDLFSPVCTTSKRIITSYLEHLYEKSQCSQEFREKQ